MDFRSQYLNFECGVYIYENPVVKDIRYDFDETLKEMSDDERRVWMHFRHSINSAEGDAARSPLM